MLSPRGPCAGPFSPSKWAGRLGCTSVPSGDGRWALLFQAYRQFKMLQGEKREGRQKVVEDIGHDVFVVLPTYIRAKGIDFQGDSLGGGLQLPNHHGHVLVQGRMVFQIIGGVFSEYPEIGKVPSIEHKALVKSVFLVIGIDLFTSQTDIVRYQMNPFQGLNILSGQKSDALLPNDQGAFDTPSP